MAEQKRHQDSAGPSDATPYAPTKAPETQAAVEGRVSPTDPRAVPGGAQGARAEIGMSAMDRADVPSGAEKPDQLDVRDTPEGAE